MFGGGRRASTAIFMWTVGRKEGLFELMEVPTTSTFDIPAIVSAAPGHSNKHFSTPSMYLIFNLVIATMHDIAAKQ